MNRNRPPARTQAPLPTQGRLPVHVDVVVGLFEQFVRAIDSGRLHDAVEPSRRLRSLGIAVQFRPAVRREDRD